MSLKSQIVKLARTEADKVVRSETAIRDLKSNQCNIMGKISKVETIEGEIIATCVLADGSSVEASLAGLTKPIGPGSSVLVINGFIVA